MIAMKLCLIERCANGDVEGFKEDQIYLCWLV